MFKEIKDKLENISREQGITKSDINGLKTVKCNCQIGKIQRPKLKPNSHAWLREEGMSGLEGIKVKKESEKAVRNVAQRDKKMKNREYKKI